MVYYFNYATIKYLKETKIGLDFTPMYDKIMITKKYLCNKNKIMHWKISTVSVVMKHYKNFNVCIRVQVPCCLHSQTVHYIITRFFLWLQNHKKKVYYLLCVDDMVSCNRLILAVYLIISWMGGWIWLFMKYLIISQMALVVYNTMLQRSMVALLCSMEFIILCLNMD